MQTPVTSIIVMRTEIRALEGIVAFVCERLVIQNSKTNVWESKLSSGSTALEVSMALPRWKRFECSVFLRDAYVSSSEYYLSLWY